MLLEIITNTNFWDISFISLFLKKRGKKNLKPETNTINIFTHLRDTVNEWAVRILLECILVLMYRFMVGLCVGHCIIRKIVQFSKLFIYPVSVDKSPRFIDNSVTGE